MKSKLDNALILSAVILLNSWTAATLWGVWKKENPELLTEAECLSVLEDIGNPKGD